MFRRVLAALRRWTDRHDDTGFVRSRLDASVLYAHGQGDEQADSELAEIRDEAERLHEARQHGRR